MGKTARGNLNIKELKSEDIHDRGLCKISKLALKMGKSTNEEVNVVIRSELNPRTIYLQISAQISLSLWVEIISLLIEVAL